MSAVLALEVAQALVVEQAAARPIQVPPAEAQPAAPVATAVVLVPVRVAQDLRRMALQAVQVEAPTAELAAQVPQQPAAQRAQAAAQAAATVVLVH